MELLLFIRCQNLQRGIDELGSSDLFLAKYRQLFGAEQALTANYLFKLLSGKVPVREAQARAIEQVLGKSSHWLDTPGAPQPRFGRWPGVVDSAELGRLSHEEQARLKSHADGLVEQWGVQDWRQARVIVPKK